MSGKLPFLFSGYFCSFEACVPVLFLVAVISLHPRFFMQSFSCCIDASTSSWMMTSPLPPSFLYTFSLSTTSLGWVMIIITIFLLWEFFTPALAYGLSLASECWKVSSSLKDFSQYSGRSYNMSPSSSGFKEQYISKTIKKRKNVPQWTFSDNIIYFNAAI